MNVETLLQEDSTNGLLADGNWKHTDYYQLDSGSNYFGCVNLITLSKQVTSDESAALVYLFQRIYNGEALKEDEMALSGKELLHWLIGAGYTGAAEGTNTATVGSLHGVRLATQQAAKKVQQIIQAQLQSKEIRVYKNNQEITPAPSLNPQAIKAVTAFLDKEDDYLYFIETDTAWMYFNAGA